MYWGIFSRYEIERYTPKKKKALLIRCLEPEEIKKENEIESKYLLNYETILELYFNDTIKEEFKNKDSFSKDMAMSLVKCIQLIDFDEINIHCAAGVSRSATIMYAIAVLLNQEDIQKEIINTKRYSITNWVCEEIYKANLKPILYNNKSKNINVNPRKNEYEIGLEEIEKNVYRIRFDL